MCLSSPHSNWCTVAGGYTSPLAFRTSTANLDRWLFSSARLDYFSRTGSFGWCLFLASFHSLNMFRAHFVLLLVFCGVYPLASSSRFSSVENWKRSLRGRGWLGASSSVGTVAVTSVLSGDDICRSVYGGRSKGSELTGNGRQSVHSHIPKQDGSPAIQTEPRQEREGELKPALIVMKRN